VGPFCYAINANRALRNILLILRILEHGARLRLSLFALRVRALKLKESVMAGWGWTKPYNEMRKRGAKEASERRAKERQERAAWKKIQQERMRGYRLAQRMERKAQKSGGRAAGKAARRHYRRKTRWGFS